MCRIIERAVTEIVCLGQTPPDKDKGCTGDFLRLHFFPDVSQRSVDIGFVRPANPIGHNHRTIGTIKRYQIPLNLAQISDRQVNSKCCAGAAEAGQILALRHGG